MNCPHCGAVIDKGMKECPFCHADLTPPPVAQDISQVGVSAIDSYSIGHVAMGIMTWLIISLGYSVYDYYGLPPLLELWMVFLFTFVVAIVWEIFENTIFWYMGKKFENRRDSILNSIWDIIFVMLGALVFWIFWYLYVEVGGYAGRWYYIIGFITFSIFVLCFVISLIYIQKTSKKKWIS
jgi:hypothetical protein